MSDNNIVVAVYTAHAEAEQAIKELQSSGFDMKRLSIVAKNPDTEEQVVGFYNAGDRIEHRSGARAFWGGMWGLLSGAAVFAIPGVGPVLVAGPLVAWGAGALENSLLTLNGKLLLFLMLGGISAIGAGLYGVGIPKDDVVKYEVALMADQFLLLVHGTGVEAAKARGLIEFTHPLELTTHALRQAETRARGSSC